jgi:hypothetical protein
MVRHCRVRTRRSCHCGAIRFAVEGDIKGAIACNCSICSRKGSLLWFVPRANFHLQTPESNLSTYLFNKHVIQHRFCRVCGIHPFAEANDPKGNPMAAINIRCLEDIDVAAIPVSNYDGKSKL